MRIYSKKSITKRGASPKNTSTQSESKDKKRKLERVQKIDEI